MEYTFKITCESENLHLTLINKVSNKLNTYNYSKFSISHFRHINFSHIIQVPFGEEYMQSGLSAQKNLPFSFLIVAPKFLQS